MNAATILGWLRALRPAAATVLILAVVAGLVQNVGHVPNPSVVEPPAFTILPQGDDAARLGPVTVTFPKTPEERAPAALFQIFPETKGTYAWLGARTALFQPDFPGFVRGSTYTVNVPARPDAGLLSATAKKFTVTGQLTVQQVIPGDGDTEVPLAAQLFVQFSRSVAPLTTLSAQRADPVVTFEPALHGTGEWLNTSIYRFLPSDLAPATTYHLKIAKGLKGAHGSVTASARTSTFTTIAQPSVASTSPTDGEKNTQRYGINVQFATPMDPATLENKIRISGFTAADLENRVYTGEQYLNINVGLKPETAYTVDLLPGATDRYGQAMGGYRFSFTTGPLTPSVSLALPGYNSAALYSSSAEPILYYQTTNLPTVEFTLYPLTADEGRRLMHDSIFNTRDFTPSQKALRTSTETVRGPKDEVVLGSTSVSGGGTLAKGYYFLRTSGQLMSQFAFAVVDTVLVTKSSVDEVLVWALDHESGTPLAGVTVRQSGRLPPSEVVSDANGLASFKAPPHVPGVYNHRSALFWIDGDGRSAVLSTRWPSLNAYQFGLQGDGIRSWVGHVYTDRPIYRPGETVQWKGVVRSDDDAQYSLPPSGETYIVTITNARGQQMSQTTMKPNEFGSFAGSFLLPSDAATGSYSLGLTDQVTQKFGFAGNSFLVAEFRKPEFEVGVGASKTAYADGDTIDASATASFFFGGALSGAGVDWSALANPFFMRAKGYEVYSFNDFDNFKPYVARDALRAKGTATTGTDGVAHFGIPATLATSEGAQQFTLSASVKDQNGQIVAGSTTVTVHPASFYAGIHPTQFVANEGGSARIDLVTVDTDGKVVPGRAVTVRVYDRQWITTKQVIPGGGRLYQSEPKDTPIATLPPTTNAKGEGSVTYRPAKSGTLRLVAEITDAKGRTARAATYLWVWGTTRASWQVTNDDAIKLVANKERYEVGETADVLVPAPFPGATALVTVERGKIKTREGRT